MKVTLKSITPDVEKTIVEIARVSSLRTDKSEKLSGLIKYLIKHNHWSPFEHGMLTMEIETSKAIGIQLLRHRSFTFQELSQRYAVVGALEPIELRQQATNNRQSSTDVFDPIIPNAFSNPQRASVIIKDAMSSNKVLYDHLLNAGVARECARMVLPMATQTTIYMSGTIRSWIHLLAIRDDSHAQKEVQLIAREMKNIFIKQCPIISEALNYD